MVERTGLRDFLKLWGNFSPFAVLAVKAKASFVSAALADTYDIMDLVPDVGRHTARDAPDPDGWASIVQLRDDSWTYVLWAFGVVSPGAQGGLRLLAEDLSSTLNTEAVAAVARASVLWDGLEPQDGGPFTVYHHLKDGDTIESAVFSKRGRILSFESAEESAEPPSGEDDLDILDRFWRGKGLYLPPCAPDIEGEHRVLSVAELDPARVEFAELVEANLTLPAEEDTLDMLLDDRRRITLSRPASTEPTGDEATPQEAVSLSPLGRLGRWMGGVLGRR